MSTSTAISINFFKKFIPLCSGISKTKTHASVAVPRKFHQITLTSISKPSPIVGSNDFPSKPTQEPSFPSEVPEFRPPPEFEVETTPQEVPTPTPGVDIPWSKPGVPEFPGQPIPSPGTPDIPLPPDGLPPTPPDVLPPRPPEIVPPPSTPPDISPPPSTPPPDVPPGIPPPIGPTYI